MADPEGDEGMHPPPAEDRNGVHCFMRRYASKHRYPISDAFSRWSLSFAADKREIRVLFIKPCAWHSSVYVMGDGNVTYTAHCMAEG